MRTNNLPQIFHATDQTQKNTLACIYTSHTLLSILLIAEHSCAVLVILEHFLHRSPCSLTAFLCYIASQYPSEIFRMPSLVLVPTFLFNSAGLQSF